MQQSQAIQNQTVHLGVQVPHEAQFRQFVVYERAPPDEGLPILDSDSSCINKSKSTISLFPFLNFVISTLSIASSLISNSNSNNNNNNNNNNDNNNNDNNINIQSNNQNVDNQNTLTFMPMNGRRRKRQVQNGKVLYLALNSYLFRASSQTNVEANTDEALILHHINKLLIAAEKCIK